MSNVVPFRTRPSYSLAVLRRSIQTNMEAARQRALSGEHQVVRPLPTPAFLANYLRAAHARGPRIDRTIEIPAARLQLSTCAPWPIVRCERFADPDGRLAALYHLAKLGIPQGYKVAKQRRK